MKHHNYTTINDPFTTSLSASYAHAFNYNSTTAYPWPGIFRTILLSVPNSHHKRQKTTWDGAI